MTVPGGVQSSMGTQGMDATAAPMSMAADGGIRTSAQRGSAPGGVVFGASDEQLTAPAKSPVSGKFGPSGENGEFETTFLRSPTAPGGGTQGVFTPQSQQQLVLPELLLRRRSALSQQLTGSLPVGLPVLGTLNMPSSNFLLGSGGTAGDTSTMTPSSPSADMSPRSDLRKQAILKRASFHVHANYTRQSLSPSPRSGSQNGGFIPFATSPTSPSSLRLLLLAAPTVAIAHDGNMIDHGINADDSRDESPANDPREFDMDTPFIV